MMGKMFESYKINTRFGKKIKEFMEDKIVFEDDTFLESDFTMFIPASTGNPIFQTSNLPLNEAGFVKIDDRTQVIGYPNIYAIGDSAALVGPAWIAKQGHIAEVMARIAAFNIKQIETGKDERQEYPSHLNILCVMDTGNGAAFIFRNSEKAFVIPLPIIGHWMKQSWGKYSKWTKLKMFPRLPGM
jgi:sulfide:quinone oxidoreductase